MIPAGNRTGPSNILTVDLEDWPQSTLDHTLPITSRVVTNTQRLLDVFARHEVTATFFVLGLVAEVYPELVREVADAGHEIATHGYGHRAVFLQTPDEFRADLRHSLHLLQDITGRSVMGYRAPDFSITKDSLWALDIMGEEGLRYDSSVFPIQGRRYGIPSVPRFVHEIRRGLLELPLSTVRIGRMNFPVAGGGYFRVAPYWITRAAIRHINALGQPAIVYFHPYELDHRELAELNYPVPWSLRLSQGLNRRTMPAKVARLLKEFRFASVREVLNSGR